MTDSPAQLDPIDRRILQAVQKAIPLQERPFDALASRLDLDESALLQRLADLRHHRRVIRQISAIFDTQSLGYRSSLVAARYRPQQLQAAADIINQHPGVSHNYQRNNDFNLWYTLAVGPDSTLGLEGTVERLHAMTGAQATRLLPTLKLYKIGVQFDFKTDGSHKDAQPSGSGPAYDQTDRRHAAAFELTEQDRRVIRLAQQDLPLVTRPFDRWADQAGCDVASFLAHLQRLLDRRQMRRFAAVLHHRTAGFTANAMTVWRADEQRIDDLGQQLAAFPAVSHCYRRPSYPDWPYNLYTMIHAPSPRHCRQILQQMQDQTGITDYQPLWTRHEFKKTRLQYFTGAIADWERRHGRSA